MYGSDRSVHEGKSINLRGSSNSDYPYVTSCGLLRVREYVVDLRKMEAFSGDEEEVLQGGEKNDRGYWSLQGGRILVLKNLPGVQNWPVLTSKNGSEERIPGDLVTGVGDKVERKGMDFMVLIR